MKAYVFTILIGSFFILLGSINTYLKEESYNKVWNDTCMQTYWEIELSSQKLLSDEFGKLLSQKWCRAFKSCLDVKQPATQSRCIEDYLYNGEDR